MLISNTVRLVPLEREHLENTLRWANDLASKPHMLRVLPVCRATHERWYEGVVSDPSKMVFAILHCDDGLHIGNTGLYHIDFLHRRAEFWVLIGDTSRQGRGAGSETTSLMRQWAFDHLNLHRLYLHVGSANSRARTMYASQGFVEEGVLREHYFIDGCYQDVIVMSQLRNEHGQEVGTRK